MPYDAQTRRSRPAGALLAALSALCTCVGGAAAGAADAGADSGVLRATLANGLRVVVVRNALAPVVSTSVNYLVG
jgi:zinc protease